MYLEGFLVYFGADDRTRTYTPLSLARLPITPHPQVAFLFSGAKIGRFSDLTNYSAIKLFV